MDVNVANEDGFCRIAVEGEMTIYTAAELKEKLLQGMVDCTELELNLGRVSEIDTAGLQLLVLVKREAAEKAMTLRFVAHSQAILDVLDMCNLAGVFGDPVVITSEPARPDDGAEAQASAEEESQASNDDISAELG